MKTSIRFNNNGLKMADHPYLPVDIQPGEKRAAIAVSHQFGGVKEQTAGLYAQKLSERGFIALAFGASHQGESEGEPRLLEDPAARLEDISSAVSYLSTHEQVDPQRIGALGICASGGYVVKAAQTERRIRAVAAISAVDIGLFFREGLGGGGSTEALKQLLEQVGRERTLEAQGGAPRYDPILPHTPADVSASTPSLYAEGTDYYRTARAQHPNSPNRYLFRSIDRITAYSSFDHVERIAPHPLLLIAGSRADTRYFSQLAYDRAQQPKELLLLEGASHIDLYDREQYVAPSVAKLDAFFHTHL
ncbi:alpha/beta hydrolase [Chromobacterium sphagni]|uniref:Dienelactone hydrolase domain-containing protein n=1 Tax=Chromobacterium sphagni TaxID=1903179 RepID=A0ABX3C711_9NEIS|nr:alpha/beta hydrolase [Chromobacterium sphagni]OHX15538.1 hypothetical protein BI344_22075 [Chromobacterium sphagni]